MPKNTRLMVQSNGARQKDCVIGTVCPANGKTFFLQTEWMDSIVVASFLNELSEFYPDKQHLIILDNVKYHHSQGTEKFLLPKNIELMYLPPYSPELNPIERLWKHFKETFLNNKLFKNVDILKDVVYQGLKTVLNSPLDVKSICTD